MTSLCDSLRAGCDALWNDLHRHPFLRELAAGTLPLERFRFFLEQDLFFLPELGRAVALGAARASDENEMRDFAEELTAVVGREIENNRELLGRVLELGAEDRGGLAAPAPATVAYTGYLVSTASRGSTLEVMTALLPCTWSYAEIATGLRDEIAAHPVYAEWVGFFASEEYVELIAARRRRQDELGRSIDSAGLARLHDVFRMSSRLEHRFWDMAYRLEQWPDLKEER